MTQTVRPARREERFVDYLCGLARGEDRAALAALPALH